MRIISSITIFLIAIVVASCGKIENDPGVARGSIIFAQYPGIQKINLSSLNIDIVYAFETDEHLYGMSQYGENSLVVSISKTSSHSDYRLHAIDLNSGKKTELGKGKWPWIVQSKGDSKIAYTKKTGRGYALEFANIKELKIGSMIWTIDIPHEAERIWHVDDNTIAMPGGEGEIWYIDISSGKYTAKPIESCHPYIWHNRKQRYVCLNSKTKSWGLIDRNLKHYEPLKGFERASPAFYAEPINTLFVRKQTFSLKKGEVSGIAVYDFDEKTVKPITEKFIDFHSFWIP